MDVSALSVSIEVDMSAFVEAMNKVAATLIATADLFERVSKDIAKSFSNIGKSSDGTSSSFGKFLDTGAKVAEILEVLIKGSEIFSGAMGGLAEEGVGETGFLGVLSSLLPELRGVAIAIGVIGAAMALFSKSGGEANKTFEEYNNNAGLLQGITNKANIQGNMRDYFKDKYEDRSDATNVVRPGEYGGQAILGQSTLGNPPYLQQDNSDISKPVTNNNNDDDLKKLTEQFEQDYKDTLTKLDKSNSPQKADIKININSAQLPGPASSPGSALVEAMPLMHKDNTIDKLAGSWTNVNNIVKKVGKTVSNTTLALEKMADASIKKISDLKNTLLQMGEKDITQGFEALGEGLGNLATKQKDPFKSLKTLLKTSIKQLGDLLISIGTPLIPIPATTVEGLAYVAGGVALDAASAAIKLAKGGIVSGSTFANIGEYAGASHNPEVVAPLDKLRNMIGGGNVHHMSAEISGDKLILLTERVTRFNGNSTGGGLGNY